LLLAILFTFLLDRCKIVVLENFILLCVCVVQMAYSRLVWSGKNGEVEKVIPSVWLKGNTVHYPRSDLKSALQECKEPEDGWLTFPLIKVKGVGKFLNTFLQCITYCNACSVV
jgi:hypothetical protein